MTTTATSASPQVENSTESSPTDKPQAAPLTADDLLRLYSEGKRGELVRGEFCETVSSGGEHGEIAMTLGGEVGSFVRRRRLGRVSGSDSGVRLERDPDTVREPDLLYISARKLPLDVRVAGYYEVVPDLIVEIMSPSDSRTAFTDKLRMWISYGVRVVWGVFPDTRTVEIHVAGGFTALTDADTLDGGDVLPGFTCAVNDIFEL